MASVRELLTEAIGHEQAGRVEAADLIYHAILAMDPDCSEALFCLGTRVLEAGNTEIAAERLERALIRRPDWAKAIYNLGLAHHAMRKWREAANCFSRVV